jgi:hypothetical protein
VRAEDDRDEWSKILNCDAGDEKEILDKYRL